MKLGIKQGDSEGSLTKQNNDKKVTQDLIIVHLTNCSLMIKFWMHATMLIRNNTHYKFHKTS